MGNIKYIFQKAKNHIAVKKNLLWKYCNVGVVAMRGFQPFDDASAFKQRLQKMLGVFGVALLDGIGDEDRKTILISAEQTLHHEFDLLGSGPVKLDPIDWHCDFKLGAKWKKTFYKELQTPKGADIKVPWELSRCQHFLWLGEAYLLTQEKKYAQEIIDEINWWIDDNPLMYSVNWKCAMDVAFRAVNWLFALNMIAEYDGIDDGFVGKVTRSLWQHGFFIWNNLEKNIPYSNNHYTSDLVGLLYLGVLFDQTGKGRRWKKKAKGELRKETLNQVLPSGVHYERSVSYHRMVTEMLSYPVYMLSRMNEPVDEEVLERLGLMYGYVSNYTKPNGLAPLIADNDDGRFAPFLRRDFRMHGYLNDARSLENRLVAVGMKPLFCTSDRGTRIYEDAGVCVVRNGNDYLYINNGGYSRKPSEHRSILGTHTHNDLLSFELAFDGKDIVVDSGTYLYTSDTEGRNRFRSTIKHNTVVVDDEEQNEAVSTFLLKRNVNKGELIRNKDSEYKGDYSTLRGQMHHERVFTTNDTNFVITDLLTKRGENHIAKICFHFAENIIPHYINERIELSNGAIISFSLKPKDVTIEDDELSPSFGILVPSKAAVVTYEFDDFLRVKTIISKGYDN